jgi:hypothetical protein
MDNESIPGLAAISGLFEIHISVQPWQIWKLRNFCNMYNECKFGCSEHSKSKMKPILACGNTGDNQNQLMIGLFMHGSNHRNVILEAEKIAIMMTGFEINIDRIKVEACAGNEGVPVNHNRVLTNPGNYFEFHLKSNAHQLQWNEITGKLVKLTSDACEKTIETIATLSYVQVGASFSAFHDNPKLIVTIRMSAVNGRAAADELLENFLSTATSYNYQFHSGIQREFSVYDNNPEYDNRWLQTVMP